MITNRRLEALERKISLAGDKSNSKLSIPELWEDFVSHCSIRSGGSMKKFDPYPYQRRLIELRKEFQNICIIKSRQLGCTQCLSSHDLYQAALNCASSSVYFMRNQDDVSSLSRRIKNMAKGLSDYIELENDSVSYIKLKGGGDIYLKNSSKEGTRSLDSITSQVYDEAAHVADIESIYGASNASSALVENSSKILLSTPSAKSGFYWQKLSENNPEDIEKLCEQVAAGELYKDFPGFYYFQDSKGVLKIIIHWLAHHVFSAINNSYQGGYVQYRIDTDNISEEVAQREYNLKFIDSSVSVFNSDLVRAGNTGSYEDSVDKEAEYYLGIDISWQGDDYTCVSVLKHYKGIYSLVHLYRKRKQTSDYHLYKIGEIIEKYKPKRIAIESNNGGEVYYEQLEKRYPDFNILKIRTTSESKPVMINRVILALERRILTYPENSLLIPELLNFRRNGRSMEAASGNHDDTVMSLAFSLTGCPLAKDIGNPFKDLDLSGLIIE
jgi:phage terminase large subunit-like protein